MKLSKVNVLMALMGLGLASQSASALTLTVFTMDPNSTNPTLNYSGGLVGVTGSFNLTGVSGVVIPAADLTGVTITFTGFSASGPATDDGTTVMQSLTGGTFTLTNSLAEVILTGSANNAFLKAGDDTAGTGVNNSSGGVFNLGDVVYGPSSGPDTLQPAINAAGFDNPGTFTFSLTGFDSTNPIVSGGVLQPFNANVNGQVAESNGGGTPPGAPLPAAALSGLGMLGAIGGVGGLVRRRRR